MTLWACADGTAEPPLRGEVFTPQADQEYISVGNDRVSLFTGGVTERKKHLLVYLMGPQVYYRFNADDGSFDYLERYTNNANTAQVNDAVRLVSSLTRQEFVFLAVPGSFGSSGRTQDQHSEQAVDVIDAAVDRLKEQFGAEIVSIAAQSAVASVAASLPARRTDIACMALGSGVYEWRAIMQERGWPTTYAGVRNPISVMAAIPAYVEDPRRRILILADPRDTRVPFSQSERFAAALRTAGHRAELTRVSAVTDPDSHHNLQTEAVLALARCADGTV